MPNSKGTRKASGEGSLRKVEKVKAGKKYVYWEARLSVGTDPGTGKQLVRSFSGKTQREVLEKMQAAAADVNKGEYFEPSKITLGAWFDIWFNTYCGDKKYLTIKQYKSMTDSHIKPALGAVKLCKLTTPMIQQFYNELQRTGRTVKEKDPKTGKINTRQEPLSAKTVKNIHGIFSKALSTAVDVGYIKNNPTERVTLPRVEKTQIVPLSDQQVKAFMAACTGHDYERVFKLILFTGLREGEALGLTWDCVDFEHKTLYINKQLQKDKKVGGEYALVPTKNSRSRIVTVADSVMTVLQKVQQEQANKKEIADLAWSNPWNLVFTNEFGQHLCHFTVYHRFKDIVRGIGLEEARFHDLRHSYAVVSIESGDDIKTVQSNLGHATASFTLDVYGHVSQKMRQQSADRMEQFIQGLPVPVRL